MHQSEPGRARPVTAESHVVEGAGTGEQGLVPVVRRPRDGGGPSVTSPSHDTSCHPLREARPVPVTVWRRVDADPAHAFDVTVPIDLTRIFRGYGPLPAVVGTTEPPGGETWGVEGQSRSVMLGDGGRMEETVLEIQHPGLFRYRVVPVKGLLRLVASHIDGTFVFARHEQGGTSIRWTYVFRPRRGARPLVRALSLLWRRYAERVIDEVARDVEASYVPVIRSDPGSRRITPEMVRRGLEED